MLKNQQPVKEVVLSKVREIETVNVKVNDITEALASKIRQVVEDVIKERVLIKPIPKVFEYPDPKPYDYPVKIPKVNADEIKENTETVVSEVLKSINMPNIIKSCMEGVKLKQYELVKVKLEVPTPDIGEIKEMMVTVIRDAFKAIDLKSLLKEALGTVDMPIPKKVDGEKIIVPQIEKGRTVIEHDIVSRKKIEIHTVHQIKDKEGNLITTLKSGDE